MEKQHNRGQDGAGVARSSSTSNPVTFRHRIRSSNHQPIADVFSKIMGEVKAEQYQT